MILHRSPSHDFTPCRVPDFGKNKRLWQKHERLVCLTCKLLQEVILLKISKEQHQLPFTFRFTWGTTLHFGVDTDDTILQTHLYFIPHDQVNTFKANRPMYSGWYIAGIDMQYRISVSKREFAVQCSLKRLSCPCWYGNSNEVFVTDL